MATRADHYVWAGELVWKARRAISGGWHENEAVAQVQIGDAGLLLAAAQVHATLATAPSEVEARVEQNERTAASAVVRAEEVRVKLLGGSVDPVVESPAYGTEPQDNL